MRKILPRTVNGPSPERVSAKSAAVTAATRVLKMPASTAISTIFLGADASVAAVVVAGSSGVAGSVQVVGTMTLSRTWMMPFDATISGAITLEPSKVIPSGPTTAASSCPESALTGPVVTSVLGTLPAMTWLVRMHESFGISASKLSRVPAGSLANASSFGAEENEKSHTREKIGW